MAADLSDELLKQIATSNGRPYSHEGRAMAAELIRRREQERKLAQAAHSLGGGIGSLAGGLGGGIP